MKMYDNYSPLDLLKRPFSSPIFKYEVKQLRWSPEFEDVRSADWVFTWKVFGFQIALVIVLVGLRPYWTLANALLFAVMPIIVLLGPFIFTVIVDFRTVLVSISFWHAHTYANGLDLLRLTMHTDTDLLNMLRAIAELTVWRGMRWEMALRGFVAIGGIAGIVLYALEPVARFSNFINFWAITLIPLWIIRMSMLYLREPLWRMRTLVALSIAVAAYIPDTNAALLVASALALCLKVMQLAGAGIVLYLTFVITRSDPDQGLLLIVIPSWLLVTPIVRTAYDVLHGFCTGLTLRSLLETSDNRLNILRTYKETATYFGDTDGL